MITRFFSIFSAAVLSFACIACARDTISADSAVVGTAGVPAEQGVTGPADSGSEYTIVVTASRRAQPSAWVSDDHKVIDVSALRQNSSKSVTEIIASHVPAFVADHGGGTVKTLSLMGAGSARTLVLVDGKRMGTAGGDLGDLSTENIEKIEVIEGGQSAQYGMDAVGGVVNIITKRGTTDRWSGTFTATTGAYEPNDNSPRLNTQGYHLSIGKKSGNLESFTAADFGRSDGAYDYFTSGASHRMDHNDFTDWGVYQKLGLTRGDLALNAALSIRDRMTDNPGSVLSPYPGTTKKNLGYTSLDGTWRVNEFFRLKADAAFSHSNIRYEPETWVPSSHEYIDGEVETVQEFSFGKQLVTTGLQGMRQSVRSSDVGFHVTGQGSAFASAVLTRSFDGVALQVMPAVRFDYSSQFKGTFNGRYGIMASLPKMPQVEPSVFANVGSSYRSPTFFELYWPYGMGNPDLKKERSFDVDGGIQLRTDAGSIGITYRAEVFFMRLDDMIVPDDFWMPQNLDKASIAGFKFKSQFRFSGFYDAAFDFVYSNARNSATDKALKYRPRYIATVSNGLHVGRVSADFTLRYSGETFIDDANTRSLPGAVTADVDCGVMLMRLGPWENGLRLVYTVLNVTNEDRMTEEGYPLPKREHRLSLKAGF